VTIGASLSHVLGPSESAMPPQEQRMIASLRHLHRTPGLSPWTGRCVDWAHDLADSVLAPFQDRRLIPRLAIRTNCAILNTDVPRQGATRDLSYSGASVLFPDYSPDGVPGALLRIKFVTLEGHARRYHAAGPQRRGSVSH
jgi:hypothetical protein